MASFFWISSTDLALVIVNFALNGYFDWILFSAWKSKEQARPHISAAQFMSLASPSKNGKYQTTRQPEFFEEESASKDRSSFQSLQPGG